MKTVILMAASLGLSATAGAQTSDTARYRLEIAVTWSASTHPLAFPPGAHLSDLVGATHDPNYTVFGDGRTASSGLELLAENGRAAILRAEFDEGLRRGRIGAVFHGEGLYTLPGVITATFDADARHRSASFVTMIAPSPDWFTGLAGVDLMSGSTWVERLELALWAWDAGTDSGETYTASDADTQPRESVRLLVAPPFFDDNGPKKVGTATFTRLR